MFKKWLYLVMVFSLVVSILPTFVVAETNSSDNGANNVVAPEAENGQFSKGEVESERTSNTKTFYLGEGKFERKIFATPIHQKDEKSGKWKEVSPNLVDKNTSEVTTEETILTPSFLKKMDNGKYVTYKYADQTISFSLMKGKDTEGNEYKPNDVQAKYKHKENRIYYNDVFPSINLRDLTFESQIKEDLVLEKYTGLNEFEYKIETQLKGVTKEDGSISFVDGKEKEILSLPKPFMEDSNIDDRKGEGVRSDNVHYSLKPLENGYQLTVTADNEWLNSSERVYPVYLDPTTSISTSSDAFVMSAYPDNVYSSSTQKWDASQNAYVLKAGYYDGTTGTNYAFIPVNPASIENMQIESATLNVYVTHHYYTNTPNGLWLDRVNEPWWASSLTWNNKPTSTNIGKVDVTRDQWAKFDVTTTMKEWVEGTRGKFGFKLHTNGNGQGFWKKIVSGANSTNKPYLSVTYTIPVPDGITSEAFTYGDGTGYVNLSWKKVAGATSYKIWIFNGATYEAFNAGNVTSWSTKGKRIWPSTGYDLNNDPAKPVAGGELPVDPSPTYKASGGNYETRKNYWFKVSAVFDQGESSVTPAFQPTIPNLSKPAAPTGEAFKLDEEKGYVNLEWDPIEGATGYKVWVYNGISYQAVDVKEDTSWTSLFSGLWPTQEEVAAGKYQLHTDGSGEELAINPAPVYGNAGTPYPNATNYWFRISAYNGLGETIYSNSITPVINSYPINESEEATIPDEIGTQLSEQEKLNLKSLGFTDSEIEHMTSEEYELNKGITGEEVAKNDQFLKITESVSDVEQMSVSTTSSEPTIEYLTEEEFYRQVALEEESSQSEVTLYANSASFTYKKMTISIIKLSTGKYRVKNTIKWETEPKNTWTDVLGIGINPTWFRPAYGEYGKQSWTANKSQYNGSVEYKASSSKWNRNPKGYSIKMNLKNPVINGIYSWSIRKRQLYMYYTVTPMDTLPAFLDAYGQYSHQIIKLDIQPSLGWKLFDLSVSPKKAFDKYSPQQVTLKLK